MTPTEKTIIDGLISRDERITHEFLFVQCRPLLSAVAWKVYKRGHELDYDELMAGFYEYLLADDAQVLRQFTGKSTIYKWIQGTARTFLLKKMKGAVIDSRRKDPLYVKKMNETMNNKKGINVSAMIDTIELERDRLVLERIDIEGKSYDELSAATGLSKANLYNIRKRALERLKKKARQALGGADGLSAIRCEQYVLDMFGIHKSLTDLKQLAEENGWLTESGMKIENLGKIPEHHGLSVRRYKGDTKAVEEAIESGRQILVAVDGGELVGNPFDEKLEDALVGKIADQCAVVLHCDAEKAILYNPAFGDIPLTVTVDTFLDAWEDSGNYTFEISKN